MTITNYPPLSGPTYPDTLDEQLRALEADAQLARIRGRAAAAFR